MFSTPMLPCRLVLVAGVLAFGLTACGRRGALEPPPAAAVPAGATQARAEAEDETPDTLLPSPAPAPSTARQQRRGYTIPKDPFILDPLL